MRGSAIRLCAVLWLFGYALVVIAAATEGRLAHGMMIVANVPLMLLGIAQAVALSMLFDRLEDWPGQRRWPAMALAGLVAAVIQTAADDAWLRLLALTLVPSWQEWAISYQPQRLMLIFVLYCWTMYLSIALVWAARATDLAHINDARAATFAAAASRAEAAALRLQLNPHFLFNTLNGITSLVVRGREQQAEEMLGRLADFLRSSLLSQPDAMVPITQELETIGAYLDIERARFGDRLTVRIATDPAMIDLTIPNFILQPLVENAIKYGVAGATGAALIQVTTTAIAGPLGAAARIELVNSGGVSGGDRTGHGIGIDNTRRRLRLHYGDAAGLEYGWIEGGYRVAIDVPLAQRGAAMPVLAGAA